jgi:hypothetical protein
MTVDFIENIEFNSFSIDLGLEVDIATLAAAGAYTDEKFAEVPEVPTKLSQLENDTNFITEGDIPAFVESVTSTDNHIVVDNADPQNPTLSFQTVDNENFVTDDELANLNNQSGTNTGDQDLSDLQPKTDALLETDSDTIVGAINEVNSIAKGANQALSFNDYQSVIAAMLVSGLNAGQNLYVDTLDVPDLWVKVVETASVPYTYVSDNQFITDILAGTQIGYYRLALLETQKVDLTNYYTKDETDQAIEDYAEPLKGTDDNYVTDAEKTKLSNLSGTNTGDQDLSGLVKLDQTTPQTIGSATARLINVFSDKIQSAIYQDLLGNNPFVSQNGGTSYHIVKWFTTTQTITISADGLSASVPAAQFTAGTSQIGAKLTVNGYERIISSVPTTLLANVTEAFPIEMRGQSYASGLWGVYPICMKIESNGNITIYGGSGVTLNLPILTVDSGYLKSTYGFKAGSNNFLTDFHLLINQSGGAIKFGGTIGLKKIADEVFELYNSVTSGQYRDLILRNITKTGYDYQSVSAIADTVNDRRTSVVAGVEIKEICTVANATKGGGTWIPVETSTLLALTDSNELIGAGSYIDLIANRSGRGSIVFGDGVGYADFIFTAASVVTLIQYTSNVFTSVQTDTNHVIIKDNGTNVRIVNEMGSAMNFNAKIQYN